MDDRSSNFRAMLVSISNKLSPTELKTLVYYAKIRRKSAETIQHATDLFKILEEKQDLKPSDLRYFRKMIEDTLDTRKDLLKIVDDYVRDYETGGAVNTESANHPDSPSQQHYLGLQEEKDFLSTHYGKGWKFFMRRLKISESDIENIEVKNKGNQREAICQCFQLWLDKQGDDASREQIFWALKSEDRNDLVRKLKKDIL